MVCSRSAAAGLASRIVQVLEALFRRDAEPEQVERLAHTMPCGARCGMRP